MVFKVNVVYSVDISFHSFLYIIYQETKKLWNILPNCIIDVNCVCTFKPRLDKFWLHQPFLANVNSSSRLLFVIGRPSVCRLSVCL